MIDPSTGFISKIGSGNFDRETLGNISLTVIAYDNGSPRLNSTAQVLIILQVGVGLYQLINVTVVYILGC